MTAFPPPQPNTPVNATSVKAVIGHEENAPDIAVGLCLQRANRHGLIAGATGTGKTVTVQKLAEQFSYAGVPVFLADVKGDLSGLSQSIDPERSPPLPVNFWDIEGQFGQHLRLGLSDLGPALIARLLALTPAQEEGLTIAFRIAREAGSPIVSIDDLRNWLCEVEQDRDTISARFGRVPTVSISTIRRRLLTIEEEGASGHFSHPPFDLAQLLAQDRAGRGHVNILVADKLIAHPRTYAMTLTWLLSRLSTDLPEIGDSEKPRLVFIFDEAHLFFRDAPKEFVEKVELIVRLIRSKGVGIYFATQHPADIPPRIISQLSNKIIHGLRCNTEQDRKMIRMLTEKLPGTPVADPTSQITTLRIGEAVVSLLDDAGQQMAARTIQVTLPQTHIGPVRERPLPPPTPPHMAVTLPDAIATHRKQKRVHRDVPMPESNREQVSVSERAPPPDCTGVVYGIGWRFGCALARRLGSVTNFLA